MQQLTGEQAAILAFRNAFQLFARTNLKIKDKSGQLVPFVLNVAQQYAEKRAQEQLKRKGYVRLLILKGRQQGISTWAQGRAYHKTSLWRHMAAFVLSHHWSTSETIFEITDRFHRNNPIAPSTGKANKSQLKFDRNESSYEVATAGSAEVGRGGTRQFYHGSEVAFWENAVGHFAASVQSVGPLPNTWVILESTANGVTGEFFKKWNNAVAGIGDYEAVFIPWFWQPEYRKEPEAGFRLSEYAEEGELSEAEYARMYGCDLRQMKWRRDQIIDSSPSKFKQEYPATAEEAFQSADMNSFIPPINVTKARRRVDIQGGGPLIMGVDPAGPGGDRFSVCFRRGNRVDKIIWRDKIDYVAAVEWLKELIDTHKPAVVFIDSGGLGGPLIAFLKAKGPKYDAIVKAVNFGSPSRARLADPKKLKAAPVNRRAEMWQRGKNWLAQDDVRLPDNDPNSSDEQQQNVGDHLQGDLTSVWAKTETNNDLLLASKSDMRSKGLRSPDLGDSFVLTFADTVYIEEPQTIEDRPVRLVDNPVSVDYNGLGGIGTVGLGWMGY